MKLSVSNGIKLLLKRVYQKFTNGSRTKKSTPKGVSPLSVLLLFPLIVKYKKHNYFWMGGVSIISGTLFRVRREPFPTSKITMLIINVCCLHLYYTIYFRHCQYLRFLFFHCTNVYLSLNLGYHTSKKHINIDHLFPTFIKSFFSSILVFSVSIYYVYYNIYPFIAQSLLPLHYYKTATLPTNTRTDLLI